MCCRNITISGGEPQSDADSDWEDETEDVSMQTEEQEAQGQETVAPNDNDIDESYAMATYDQEKEGLWYINSLLLFVIENKYHYLFELSGAIDYAIGQVC